MNILILQRDSAVPLMSVSDIYCMDGCVDSWESGWGLHAAVSQQVSYSIGLSTCKLFYRFFSPITRA